MTDGEPADARVIRPAQLAGRQIAAEFRLPATVLLAGGPVDLDTILWLTSGGPVTLTTSVERATGRSRDYRFAADAPDGSPLSDPYAETVEMGGVQTSFQLTSAAPLRDKVLLNQFLSLERIRPMLDDGASVDLRVSGTRQLHLDGNDGGGEETAESEFTVRLSRDDAALSAELGRIAQSILETSSYTVDRGRQMLVLATIRDPIGADALTVVAGHQDAEVAAMAHRALAALAT